jgi:hypothetical protein
VKIIDRAKAYIRQKKERDRSSTGYPLDGVADPAPAQRDRAGDKQNRDDKTSAVSTAHETSEPEPAIEPTTEPATESATESATAPATEPTTESATEPTTAPAACPRCGATGEAPCTTPSGKATKTHKGREQ